MFEPRGSPLTAAIPFTANAHLWAIISEDTLFAGFFGAIYNEGFIRAVERNSLCPGTPSLLISDVSKSGGGDGKSTLHILKGIAWVFEHL